MKTKQFSQANNHSFDNVSILINLFQVTDFYIKGKKHLTKPLEIGQSVPN